METCKLVRTLFYVQAALLLAPPPQGQGVVLCDHSQAIEMQSFDELIANSQPLSNAAKLDI